MAVEYDFREQPGSNEYAEEKFLFPRVVTKRTIKADEFIEKVAKRTTFTPGEVRGIMQLMAETMTDSLLEGYSVELEDIGFFTASLTARPVKTKKEIRSASVSIDGVNLRVSKILKTNLKKATLVRAKYGFGKSSQGRSPQERRKLVEEYLKVNYFISRKVYSELSGLLKDKALEDLNGWVKEGWLKSQGNRSTKIFLKSFSEATE